MKDRDVLFHERWLGLAQPIEGLVFSVPVLADAQIAPEVRAELGAAFAAVLTPDGARIASAERLFRDLLGYAAPGMLVPAAELPAELAFYAAEGGQEIRPTFAIARGPFASVDDDPFADLAPAPAAEPATADASLAARYVALVWDLGAHEPAIDPDAPEAVTGPWRYPPTAKLERLLRHTGVAVGFLATGAELRLVYAPPGQSTGHLTFRVAHLARPDGRPLLAALELLCHARRTYGAAPAFTLEGLLAESRRRQADVTDALARQVFEAVELLVAGFEAAAARDAGAGRPDWLRAALEEPGDHFYQGVLAVVLRLVFLLYAEDQGLLPVEHPIYAEHLGLFGLHARLTDDLGAHPESMHHRFGAYGQLLALFRAVFFGVRHGALHLPPRRGRLFDPNAYPFLEGGLPGWTSAVVDPAARAAAAPPSLDDGTIQRVLHRLVVFQGQRLSYRALDVEQIGSVYESLMGYHVLRVESPAVRVGKLGVWLESAAVRRLAPAERAKLFKEGCALGAGPAQGLEKALREAKTDADAFAALSAQAAGRKAELGQHRVEAGRLVLQPGEERRRTASHYTPRALTEGVVARTLAPLLACLGPERTPEQLLALKICDPAMGSGAFLVATCRALAAELVAAWTRQGELARVLEAHGDAHRQARRLVAQQCLYGVDKNAAAVELAKLSLWLVTLSRELPFTFVDHALRHGDSLVGLDFRQIEAFHWAPAKQVETCRVALRDALDEAIALRQKLVAVEDADDAASLREKRRLHAFAEQAIDRVRTVADLCVGAFFAAPKDAARETERRRRLALVERWLAGEDSVDAEVRALAHETRARLAPFHWWIEFPEVFFEGRPDPLAGSDAGAARGAALMEGVVGNPPFGGKNNIAEASPEGYLDWLKIVSPGAHGNADLSAHFFRRAARLLGENGALGLIATNTIAQGDTRSTGLKALVDDGWQLYDATSALPWPGGAAVTVSIVHAGHGRGRSGVTPRLDGRDVEVINSRLRPKPERPDPQVLAANVGASFQGSIVLGMGFTLTPEERAALVAKDPRNAERTFPYLGGEEVNTSPTQDFDRYVISFGQMPLEEAERWPDLLRIVREKVKPERDTNNRDVRRIYWWRFGEVAPALYAAIAPLPRCLVTAQVTKHLCFSFQPTDRIYSQKLYILPLPSFTAFGVLQSRVHEPWVRLLSSTMKMDLNYSASDCFETFPFPEPEPRAVIPAVEAAGEALYEARARFMVETGQGLTKTYNALKDPAVTEPAVLALRRLHEALDRAVLDAYGFRDLAVPPYCPSTPAEEAALAAFVDEIVDRLYVLNAARAHAEARLGLGAAKPRAKKPARGGARATDADAPDAAPPATPTHAADADAPDAPAEDAPTRKRPRGKKPAASKQRKLLT